MKKFKALLLTAMGVALLLVATIGHFTVVGNYRSAPPAKGELFEPDMENRLNNMEKLMDYSKRSLSANPDKREIMSVLHNVVAQRFTNLEAQHTFFSNWLIYLFGKAHPAFLHIWDPDILLAKGHSGFCDQSSYVLLSLALKNGIKARHVGLDGHVVMEAWYASDWHLYDPDREVIPIDSEGQVLSLDELARDKKSLDQYYGKHGFTQIIGSRDKATYMTYPEGARFEWKSNALVYFERLMEVLKFAIPVGLMLAGLWQMKRR